MFLPTRSSPLVSAVTGLLMLLAAPAVCRSDSHLDDLLNAYRVYGLPLPPSDAQLATVENTTIVFMNFVRQHTYYLVLATEEAHNAKPASILAGVREFDVTTNQHLRVVPSSVESFDGTETFEPRDWYHRFPTFPDLALAVQCQSLGWSELAQMALARSRQRSGGHTEVDCRPYDDRDALARLAWNHYCDQFSWSTAARRPIILTRMKQLVDSRAVVNTLLTRTLVTDIEETLCPRDVAPGSLEAAIEGLLELDASADEIQMEARNDALSLDAFVRSNPHCRQLRDAGSAALPVLRAHLDDFRVTRAIERQFGNGYTWHIRIADIMAELLIDLAAPPTESRSWRASDPASNPLAYDFLLLEGRGRRLDQASVAHWWEHRNERQQPEQLPPSTTGKTSVAKSKPKGLPRDDQPNRPDPEVLSGAIRAGDLAEVKRLVDRFPSLVARSEGNGSYPLDRAVRENQVEIAKFLIDNQAEVESEITRGVRLPPIFHARSGEMARLLLDHGVRWDLTDPTSRKTPLQLAAADGAFEVVHVLMEAGAPLDFDSAVRLGWTDEVKHFLHDRPWLAKRPRMPLHTAIWHGNRELVALLLKYGADPNADFEFTNVAGPCTPMTEAVTSGDYEVTEMLLDHRAYPNVSGGRNHDNLLNYALAYLEPRFTQIMLAHGADVYGLGTSRRRSEMPVHVAASLGGTMSAGLVQRWGQPQGVRHDEDEVVEKMQLLIAAGADPNTIRADGATPLLLQPP